MITALGHLTAPFTGFQDTPAVPSSPRVHSIFVAVLMTTRGQSLREYLEYLRGDYVPARLGSVIRCAVEVRPRSCRRQRGCSQSSLRDVAALVNGDRGCPPVGVLEPMVTAPMRVTVKPAFSSAFTTRLPGNEGAGGITGGVDGDRQLVRHTVFLEDEQQSFLEVGQGPLHG